MLVKNLANHFEGGGAYC